LSPTAPSVQERQSNALSAHPVTRVLLWMAAADEQDLVSNGDRVLYIAIGYFVCLFGIYGCVAYFGFLTRIGLPHVAPGVGTALTILTAFLVTTAVMVFDRTLVAQTDAGLDKLTTGANQSTGDMYLHPVGRRKSGLFVGRLLIALVVSLFATQTIELFVFKSDIQHSQREMLESKDEEALRSAEDKKSTDEALFNEHQSKRLTQFERLDELAHYASVGQHNHCAPGTSCARRSKSAKSTYRAYKQALPEDPSLKSSVDSERVATSKQELEELKTHSDRMLSRDSSVLQDVTALYPYLIRHIVSLIYFGAFSLIFLCLDLGALLLKYGFARNTEYERRQAARQRVRWLQAAEQFRVQAASASPSSSEETEAHNEAKADRQRQAELVKQAREIRYQTLLDAYSKAHESGNVAASARAYVETDILRRLVDPPLAEAASDPLTLTTPPHTSHSRLAALLKLERPVDPSFLIGVLGAVGGIIAFVYLLGGAYMYSQLSQASLPVTALTYVSARTLIRDGVVIATLSLMFIICLAGIIRPLAAWIIKTLTKDVSDLGDYRTVLKAIWSRLLDWRRPIAPRAISTPSRDEVTRSTVALAVAVVAGELSDIGFSGGLEIFGAFGVVTLLFCIVVLALFGLFNPDTGLSRFGAVLLMTIFSTVGAYEAGQLRPLTLPTAQLRIVGSSNCIVAGFLAESPTSVYLVDRMHKRIEVVPWRTIADIALGSNQTAPVRSRVSPPCKSQRA
jgi:Domain of unknown function (DUF4407)